MVFVGELASCKILSKKKSSSQKLRKKPPSHPLQPYENGCSSRQEPIGQRFAWFPIPAKNQPRVGGGFVVVNRAPFRPVFFLDGFEHGLIFGRKFLGIPNFVSTVKMLKKGENFPPEKKQMRNMRTRLDLFWLLLLICIYIYKTKVTVRKTLAGNEVTLTLRILKLAVTCTNMFDLALKTSPSLGSPL